MSTGAVKIGPQNDCGVLPNKVSRGLLVRDSVSRRVDIQGCSLLTEYGRKLTPVNTLAST